MLLRSFGFLRQIFFPRFERPECRVVKLKCLRMKPVTFGVISLQALSPGICVYVQCDAWVQCEDTSE